MCRILQFLFISSDFLVLFNKLFKFYSYISWAASAFSIWTIAIFNISRLITISMFQKNYVRCIISCVIFVAIIILFLTIPTAIAFNIKYGNCVILLWSEINSNFLLLVLAIIFLFALALYFFGSFVLLPLIGVIMGIKLIKIKQNSRKLTGLSIRLSATKLSSKYRVMTDIRLLISQILVSNFAVIFNLPMAITSILNIGMVR